MNPAPPPPPPLQQPYSLLGRLQDAAEREIVYLRKGNTLILAKTGSMLEGGFKVAHIDRHNIHLVHEPGGEQFVLRFPTPDSSTF